MNIYRYFKLTIFLWVLYMPTIYADNVQGQSWNNTTHGNKVLSSISSCPDGQSSMQGNPNDCHTKEPVALSLGLLESVDCDDPIKIQMQGTKECTANSKTVYLENTQLNIAENATTSKSLGILSILHFGDGSKISSYKLLGDGNNSFSISDLGELFLKDGVELDYETTQNYNLRVEVTTYRGTSNEVDLNLTILNIDKAPAEQIKKIPLLVIRIEFNDYTFDNDASVWASKIFGTKKGQLNHYYNEISYGKFQFDVVSETDGTNDGVISVLLDKDHPGNDDFDVDEYYSALSKASEYIDYSIYDKNKNGSLSASEFQVLFLIAGGEASTGVKPGIWANSSCFQRDEEFDGVYIINCTGGGKYAAFGEKHSRSGQDATIGIMAHELGHSAFDLPDLYDIDSSSEGIGIFGLMSGGSWNSTTEDAAHGATPAHMSGWSKVKAGFVVANVIDNDKKELAIYGAGSMDYNLLRINTSVENEYFLIENRSAVGYDLGLSSLDDAGDNYAGGLLILHIDDNENSNEDEDHKWVDVEEANNAGLDKKSHEGHINNLFFNGNKTEFTPQTTPNSNTYNSKKSGISITNISDSGSTMRADITIEIE